MKRPYFNVGAIANRQDRIRRQTGSVVIMTAITLSLIVILLIGSELGYLFFIKRELQKTADLAALAGAQVLQPNSCGTVADAKTAKGAASANAAVNMPVGVTGFSDADMQCGRWDPATRTGPQYFSPSLLAGETFNAVQVTLRREVLRLLSRELQTISVQATAAKDAPAVVFSVGSKLVDTTTAPLTSLLKFAGADISGTCLACYTGLAGIKITPGGLLSQLGIPVGSDVTVGGLNTLLAANKLSVGQVINAIATVAGQTDLLSANASLINSLSARFALDSLLVQLGTDPLANNGARGLFAQITAPTASSALNAQVDALSLLTAAVGVGVSNHAVVVPIAVAPLGVNVEARIVEPPSIGIGGVGTRAYNSQVRVHLVLDSGTSVLSGILGVLGTSINVPITLDVVNALGEVTNINCDAAPHTATIQVAAPLLNACVGQISPSVLWSTADACSAPSLTSMTFVKLAGIDLLKGTVHVPALPNNPPPLTLTAGETAPTASNGIQIGTTLSTLFTQLTNLLVGGSPASGSNAANRALTPDAAAAVASKYLTRAGVLGNGRYNVSSASSLLTTDGFTWNRPGACLPIVGCLLSQSMPSEWSSNVATACSGSASAYNSCAATQLQNSLQTPVGNGLVSGLVGGVLDVVSGILGISPASPGAPLLATILSPLINLLQGVLNTVGSGLSSFLSNALGVEIGRTDVHLQSLSCQNAKLVY